MTVDKVELQSFICDRLTEICQTPVSSKSSVLKTALIDSMGLIELIVAIQDKYAVTVDITEIKKETFDTPEQMVHFLTSI